MIAMLPDEASLATMIARGIFKGLEFSLETQQSSHR